MKIVVSGSTGLVGSALTPVLASLGHDVVPLVRRRPAAGEGGVLAWDPERGMIDCDGLEGIDAAIHLAGENVFGRWSPAKKQRIRESRVQGTRLLSDALAGLTRPPKTLLAASAIGYYGDRGDEAVSEWSAPGEDFLAYVSRDWEGATTPAARAGIRVVNMRFGVVLTTAGGALAKMLPAFRLGLGGRVGSGNQYLSWIMLDDVLNAIVHGLATTTPTRRPKSPSPGAPAAWRWRCRSLAEFSDSIAFTSTSHARPSRCSSRSAAAGSGTSTTSCWSPRVSSATARICRCATGGSRNRRSRRTGSWDAPSSV